MTLLEFLNDIKARYSFSASDESLIRWLNFAQREVYDKIGIDDIWEFTATEGLEEYPLPNIVDFACIKAITVDEVQYKAKNVNEIYNDRECWYKVSDNVIGFYPALNGTETIKIYYTEKPNDFYLTPALMLENYNADRDIILLFDYTQDEIDEMTDEEKGYVELDEDETCTTAFNNQTFNINDNFINMLAYAVLGQVAQYNNDISASNNFRADYNRLYQLAWEHKQKRSGKYQQTQDVMKKQTKNRTVMEYRR